MQNKKLGDARLLDRDTMTNCEDAYNLVLHNTGKNRAYFVHYHDHYEISFYLGREPGTYIVGQEEYHVMRGDIVLCDIFQPHMLKSENNAGHERFHIGLDPRILLAYSTIGENLLQIFGQKGADGPVIRMDLWKFQKYLDLINSFISDRVDVGKGLWERARIYQVLAYLYADTYEANSGGNINAARMELLSQLIHYIETHLDSEISLEILSEVTNYSTAHISRIFKEETNETLVHYILEKKTAESKTAVSRPDADYRDCFGSRI